MTRRQTYKRRDSIDAVFGTADYWVDAKQAVSGISALRWPPQRTLSGG
jgi:hypothetical protein